MHGELMLIARIVTRDKDGGLQINEVEEFTDAKAYF